MPKFTVEKSIVVNAPLEKVYATVRNFEEWKEWSPWIIADPAAKLTYMSNAEGYSWDGAITGSGQMEVTGETEQNSIEYRLEFVKPWKSVCPVTFSFAEKDGGTEATWTMHGSLPFFMFFMTKMMAAFVGMDYERGLKMLKDYIETGSVPSKLEFPGKTAFAGCSYIGHQVEGNIDDIKSLMGTSFEKVGCWLKETGTEPIGKPFSIYGKWDPVKGIVNYTLGFPVETPPSPAPEGFVTGKIPAMDVYPVKHTGSYNHLGNAWAAGVMHGRSKQFKQSRKANPFEIYESNPEEVAEADILTVVNFPM